MAAAMTDDTRPPPARVFDLADAKARKRREKPCPICGEPSPQTYHPFCSKRCADLDLGNWLDGAYRLPADEIDEEALDELTRDADRTGGFGGGDAEE